MNRVYVFACRLGTEAELMASREIDRERALYNQMIAEYNPHPRQRALTVCARHKLAEGSCYTGSHFAAMNDFQRATSAKRIGVWPGDPYRFRSRNANDGAMVGVVFMKSSGMTWGKITGGSSRIFSVETGQRYCAVRLKVSREEEPIEFTCHLRREIPPDAIVTSAYLARTGTYGRRHKWELRVTFSVDTVASDALAPASDPIGVDVGWQMQDDGGLLVAVTSDGRRLVIPPYAIRMAPRSYEIQKERDLLANAQREKIGEECTAKSANGTAYWCEQHRPESEREYIENDRALRCRQDHTRERLQNIRADHYRKFVASLGCQVFILKSKLKVVAEEEKKGEELNKTRTWAALHELIQLLRNAGAVEVECERLGDASVPCSVNAEKIRDAGIAGSLHERAARKPVRKFRKRLDAA